MGSTNGYVLLWSILLGTSHSWRQSLFAIAIHMLKSARNMQADGDTNVAVTARSQQFGRFRAHFASVCGKQAALELKRAPSRG